MRTSLKRIFKITGIVVLILGTIVITASNIISARLEEKIREKLLAAGFNTQSVSISLINRSVELDSIFYVTSDTTIKNSHQLFIQKINVSGIHIYSLLKNKEIIIDRLVLRDGKVQYNKNFKLKKDSTTNSSEDSNTKVNGIRIKHLEVTNVDAAMVNDTTSESSAIIKDFEVSELNLSLKQDTTYSIGWIEARLENLKQSKKGELHSFSISKIDYISKDERLEVDSFKVIPKYNKEDFARIAKIQKTRLDILLPKIIFEGVNQDRFMTDSTLEVTRISIPKAVVHAYRDKRYPFVRDWIMPLPIEGLRRIPFKLRIDSILIQGANIAYEEFSDKGLDASGTITFDNLDASFAGLTTEIDQPEKDAFCTLIADCKVMDNGSLHATFKFPLNSTVNYEANGNLRNMDLTSLNPTLGNLTRIEIKEGTLNDLHYNFSYNDNVSTGEVLINYSNLNLSALKKEKEREVNKVLSAVINTVVRSTKDKSMDQDKRIGEINIERDKKRFVFQFWWKSLLDGLQSTFTDNGKKDNDKKKKTQKGSSK
jgi:hypothetical protein